MNEIIKSLYERKSMRVYEDRPIPEKMKQIILEAAAQAPSAGCQQLYTILDITDQKLKDELVKTCDNQPFIATAPMVLVFCADCKKWYDAYLEAGCYAWNSGMFIWKASTILSYYKKLLPDIYDCLMQLAESFGTPREEEVLWEIYPRIPKISVDYGIMERADHVLMLTGDFGWSDVGGWDAFDALKDRDENQNLTVGKTLLLDSRNCTAYSVDKLIAAVGVSDLIIVQAGEAVLVCPQSEAQRVKEIVEALSEKGENSYL